MPEYTVVTSAIKIYNEKNPQKKLTDPDHIEKLHVAFHAHNDDLIGHSLNPKANLITKIADSIPDFYHERSRAGKLNPLKKGKYTIREEEANELFVNLIKKLEKEITLDSPSAPQRPAREAHFDQTPLTQAQQLHLNALGQKEALMKEELNRQLTKLGTVLSDTLRNSELDNLLKNTSLSSGADKFKATSARGKKSTGGGTPAL